jgi:tetratricopeptide (TPR) repeat protein
MLGSIQVKRGDLKEAMLIYELALKDGTVTPNEDEIDAYGKPPIGNLLAKSVTFREIGIIKERWGHLDEARDYYHQSLECVQEWKVAYNDDDESFTDDVESNDSLDYSLSNVRLEKSTDEPGQFEEEKGEMELCLVPMTMSAGNKTLAPTNRYEEIFPSRLEKEFERKSKPSKDSPGKNETDRTNINSNLSKDAFADMDLALTLHHIAQLYRKQGNFTEALQAFEVALRGMKYSLGRYHPNVAAVLGNVGNLQKEMGDLDAAYKTYQEVLAIESYRLGLSHPDVAITVRLSCGTCDPLIHHRLSYNSFNSFTMSLQLTLPEGNIDNR